MSKKYNNDYICDDREQLSVELVKKIQAMTEEEFEEHLKELRKKEKKDS